MLICACIRSYFPSFTKEMILIAKGKFSQPRKPRQDLDNIPEYVSPLREGVQDSSMDETRLLTGVFQPIRDPEAPAPVPVAPAPQDTMTFEESEFIQQTTVYNTEESLISPQLTEDDYDYEEELRQRKREAARKNAKNRKILWISIACVSIALVVAIALCAVVFLTAEKDDGLILNNVTVAGVNVGGMTPEEAAAAIHRATDMTYSVESMIIYLPDTIIELSPKDTKAKLDVNAAVEAAYNYGRTGTAEENKKAEADSLVSNHTIALLPYLTLDTDYIRQVLNEYGSGFNSIYEASSWELTGEMPELEADKFDENDYRSKYIVVDEDGKRSFRMTEGGNGSEPLYITQGDVRQVQLAKGAILSGFMALMKKAGIGMADLDRVLIAGQFGAHLPAESITGTGILPFEVEDRIEYVGNTSKTGAYMALMSGKVKRQMEELAHDMDYLELGATDNYERLLSECLIFPVFK